MVIAYLRVSTEKQHVENQKSEIARYAASRNITINRWVTEVISGKKALKSRKLGTLIKSLSAGDTLIVTEISRLSRTLHEIMAIMGHCLENKITIYSTKDGYSFDDSINSKVMSFAFGLVAEIERNLISQRTKEALAARRAEGVVLGRKKGYCPKIAVLDNNKTDIIYRLTKSDTISAICTYYGVSTQTFSKFRRKNPEIDEAINGRFGQERRTRLRKNG